MAEPEIDLAVIAVLIESVKDRIRDMGDCVDLQMATVMADECVSYVTKHVTTKMRGD